MDANVQSASLITKTELEGLGCSSSSNTCSDAPAWVYATTYWSASSNDEYNVWFVDSDMYFGINIIQYDRNNGVRPVITVSADEFK